MSTQQQTRSDPIQTAIAGLAYGDLKMLSAVLSAFVENHEADCAQVLAEEGKSEPEEVTRARALCHAVEVSLLCRLGVAA